MRWRRVSVRTLMIIVPLISLGLAIASKEMLKRRKSHLEYVTIFARRGSEERKNLVDFEAFRRKGMVRAGHMDLAKLEEASRRRVVYYAETEAMFRLAADQPWRPEPVIRPDPGEELMWEAAFEVPKLDIDWAAFSEPPEAPATVPKLSKAR